MECKYGILKTPGKKPTATGPGRPDTGIRSGYARVESYIPTDVRDALDRLADRRETRTASQRAVPM